MVSVCPFHFLHFPSYYNYNFFVSDTTRHPSTKNSIKPSCPTQPTSCPVHPPKPHMCPILYLSTVTVVSKTTTNPKP
ncbi:hypothetical protein M6B38_329070 [Iris pallida]|uniref:Uncharacterized protein n=1 Tax=Iris pallida TaxID=29817 RepID=A0AAX6GNS3_IRIPA|nr:hypothetical protein M6B38_355370 [Iris pallida]KAJ6835973.1 hypothetical protein M6B38_329070 [Iris pallida]